MTFQQLVQAYFGSVRPVSEAEVAELKNSLTAGEWKQFIADVRNAHKAA